jgi:hypothetical protein
LRIKFKEKVDVEINNLLEFVLKKEKEKEKKKQNRK